MARSRRVVTTASPSSASSREATGRGRLIGRAFGMASTGTSSERPRACQRRLHCARRTASGSPMSAMLHAVHLAALAVYLASTVWLLLVLRGLARVADPAEQRRRLVRQLRPYNVLSVGA